MIYVQAIAKRYNCCFLYTHTMPLSPELLILLKNNPPMLTKLDLSNQQLDDEDIGLLVDILEQHCLSIHSLNLQNNNITSIGAIRLNQIKSLKNLNLAVNQLGDEGAKIFADNSNLTELDLSFNGIKDFGAIELSQNQHLKKLKLSNNHISYPGAHALSFNDTIKVLDLSGNFIEDASALMFANNQTLQCLVLSANYISTLGAMMLAQNKSITYLDLSFNKISSTGMLAFKYNQTLSHLFFQMNPSSMTIEFPIQNQIDKNRENYLKTWISISLLCNKKNCPDVSQLILSFLPHDDFGIKALTNMNKKIGQLLNKHQPTVIEKAIALAKAHFQDIFFMILMILYFNLLIPTNKEKYTYHPKP